MYRPLMVLLDVRQMYDCTCVCLVGRVWRVSHRSFAVAVECIAVHRSRCCVLRRDAAYRAALFPELRWLLLSGRRRHAMPAAVSDALATSSAVHGDMMAGRSPLLLWMMRGCGAGIVCGGIGERLKAVRMALYVALLSRRARWWRVWRGGAALQCAVARCAVSRRPTPWMQCCCCWSCSSRCCVW
jgi:hypothetical protein